MYEECVCVHEYYYYYYKHEKRHPRLRLLTSRTKISTYYNRMPIAISSAAERDVKYIQIPDMLRSALAELCSLHIYLALVTLSDTHEM
jgi:hypothetical protein